jgi:hypothetical protein
VGATHRRNGLGWPAHLDLRRGLAPKEIQQQFTRRPAEPRRRRAGSNRHPLPGPRPLDLEPVRAKPPAQKAPATPNVSPQPGVHGRPKATNPEPVGPAHVLVVDEELVEIRHLAHPPYAEEPDGRAGLDPRDELRKVRASGQSGATPLVEPLERTRQNHAWTGDEIVFAQHKMSGEIVGGPPVEQGGNGRAEFVEKTAQLKALLRVERDVTHKPAVYGALTTS